MTNFAGIIYPTSVQVAKHIKSLSSVFLKSDTFELFRYKNLELGIWDKMLFVSKQKNIWVLFDGFLVNAKSLRKELEKLGACFMTSEDEEVILHAYTFWGAQALKRFDGPFAIAIFDASKEVLLLARDRIGQRALYWSHQGKDFLFSTEIKGLLATGLVAQQPSLSALGAYLHFGYFPQDLTPIQHVSKLLPGYYLEVNLKREHHIFQYWSLSDQTIAQQQVNLNQALEKCESLIENSLEPLLERPMSLYLSDNIGAKTLAAIAASKYSKDLTACSIASSKKQLDHHHSIASHFGFSFTGEVFATNHILDDLVQTIWDLDEPIASFQALRIKRLANLVQQQNSTLCLPTGWQELFAGSPRHLHYGQKLTTELGLAHHLSKWPSWLQQHVLLPAMRLLRFPSRYEILRYYDLNTPVLSYLLDSAIFQGVCRKEAAPYLAHYFHPVVFTQRFHRLVDLPGELSPSLYFDMKTNLPDNMLFQMHRLLSSASVTSYYPYLDINLLNFVPSIPDDLKFNPSCPAYLLEQLLLKLSPNCPKKAVIGEPFSTLWKKEPKIRRLFQALAHGILVEEGYINKKWIEKQVYHPDFTQTAFEQLWTLLILEIWFRLMITAPIDKINPRNIDLFELLGISRKNAGD